MTTPDERDRARAARSPEVLAPAGDARSLAAALHAGADAVYFGLQEGFNARARAGNFSLATLDQTVAEIHRAGARAYLALNTLVFEPELPFVERVLRRAGEAGVDALIVQDPAVALAARRLCPQVEVHASTQMTISSADAAIFAADLGATRVVLPRELSVREIATFMAGSDLEVEVFVHGALCVSWSGQCLTSEAWGGRSANRGQCAQSCRMPYELVVDGDIRPLEDVRYLLSPKDLAGARAVPELARLGVHGLKIEGRQKGAHYVATAVRGYRHWVDAVAGGAPDSLAAAAQLRQDLLAMSLAYTRGASDGFLAGSDHQSLVEGRFPKHRGVLVGRVVGVAGRDVEVDTRRAARAWTGALGLSDRPSRPAGEVSAPLAALGARTDAAAGPAPAPLELRPGHGVVFDGGDPEDANEPGGPVFRVERRGQNLVLGFGKPGPDLARVRPGQRVWVTSDSAALAATERLLERPVPAARQAVELRVQGRLESPVRVEARCGDVVVHAATRRAAVAATGAGLTDALLAEKLGLQAETPYRIEQLDTSELAPGLHVPVSELKSLRREIVARLREQVADSQSADLAPAPARQRTRAAARALAASDRSPERERPQVPSAEPEPQRPAVVPLCRTDAQLEGAIAAGVREVELDWMESVGLAHAAARARAAGLAVTVATLRVQKPGEESFDERVARLRPDGVLVRHWGGLVHFARVRAAAGSPAARVHGDFSLNVTNSVTAQHVLDWGLDTVTAAHDLDEDQLFALLGQVPAHRIAVVVHHRIATFHTEHCVYAHLLSNGRDYRTCGRPCEQHQVSLRDHLRQEHPVIVDAGCRNTVFNSAVQSAAKLVPRLLGLGVRRFRVEFVRETREETATVLAAYAALLAGRMAPADLLRELGVAAQQGVSARPMQLLR